MFQSQDRTTGAILRLTTVEAVILISSKAHFNESLIDEIILLRICHTELIYHILSLISQLFLFFVQRSLSRLSIPRSIESLLLLH